MVLHHVLARMVKSEPEPLPECASRTRAASIDSSIRYKLGDRRGPLQAVGDAKSRWVDPEQREDSGKRQIGEVLERHYEMDRAHLQIRRSPHHRIQGPMQEPADKHGLSHSGDVAGKFDEAEWSPSEAREDAPAGTIVDHALEQGRSTHRRSKEIHQRMAIMTASSVRGSA